MIAVFLSFFIAKISIVRELGTGLAIAVFFDAFIVRTFLMPAVLAALGGRVWGKRQHDVHSDRAVQDGRATRQTLVTEAGPEAVAS